jgi:hypothetical protein
MRFWYAWVSFRLWGVRLKLPNNTQIGVHLIKPFLRPFVWRCCDEWINFGWLGVCVNIHINCPDSAPDGLRFSISYTNSIPKRAKP